MIDRVGRHAPLPVPSRRRGFIEPGLLARRPAHPVWARWQYRPGNIRASSMKPPMDPFTSTSLTDISEKFSFSWGRLHSQTIHARYGCHACPYRTRHNDARNYAVNKDVFLCPSPNAKKAGPSSREGVFLHDLPNVIGDDPQVFGNDRQGAERFLSVSKNPAGTQPIFRWRPSNMDGDLPILTNPAKNDRYADNRKDGGLCRYAHPPRGIRMLSTSPDRIPGFPALACLAEITGRRQPRPRDDDARQS